MNQRARTGNAGLACCSENSRNDSVYCLIEIRVIEDNVRRFPAQLERHMLDPACRELVNILARAIAACEGNLSDIRVCDQRLANFVSITSHYVDDTGREACSIE